MQSAACHSVFMRFPSCPTDNPHICDYTGLDCEICGFWWLWHVPSEFAFLGICQALVLGNDFLS